MSRLYMYVVDRDFGFAPNPFHGHCTLATCKPQLRARAQVGDWVVGMGGARLKATGRCVFAMLVAQTLPFNDYWTGAAYFDKRPVRNGSRRMMVGDNIYRFEGGVWHQADSHHSNPDGSQNIANVANDTRADRVLVSRHFYYFGRSAPRVPLDILSALGFRNGRAYRVFGGSMAILLVRWLHMQQGHLLNTVADDPFDFAASERRYSSKDNRIR